MATPEDIIEYVAMRPSFFRDYEYYDRNVKIENGTIDVVFKKADKFLLVEIDPRKADHEELGKLLGHMAEYAYLNKLNHDQIEGALVAPDFRSDVLKIGEILDNVICIRLNEKEQVTHRIDQKSYSKSLSNTIFLRDSLESLVNDTIKHIIGELKRGSQGGAFEAYQAISGLVIGDSVTLRVVSDFQFQLMSGKRYDNLNLLIEAFQNLRCMKLTI